MGAGERSGTAVKVAKMAKVANIAGAGRGSTFTLFPGTGVWIKNQNQRPQATHLFAIVRAPAVRTGEIAFQPIPRVASGIPERRGAVFRQRVSPPVLGRRTLTVNGVQRDEADIDPSS